MALETGYFSVVYIFYDINVDANTAKTNETMAVVEMENRC